MRKNGIDTAEHLPDVQHTGEKGEGMIELKELTERTLTLFQVSDFSSLGSAVMDACSDHEKLDGFCSMVENDLSVDWMQKIFQYYFADREGKKQDFTPKCLADFMGRLADNPKTIIDMCAGSGALTIQKWNQNHDQKFILYELDENVIPFLLFNLVIRNIDSIVCRGDMLQNEVYDIWSVTKGEKYGNISRL